MCSFLCLPLQNDYVKGPSSEYFEVRAWNATAKYCYFFLEMNAVFASSIGASFKTDLYTEFF